jgi:four helix bundle protein
MTTIKNFTELEVWQLGNELEKKIYVHISAGSLSKDFALKDQINRSVGSIPDNIAEGFGRGGRLEFIQFLSISRGSESELQSQLIRCQNRNHISKEVVEELYELTAKTGNKIGSFIKYLNASEKTGPKFQNRVNAANTKQATNNGQQQTFI